MQKIDLKKTVGILVVVGLLFLGSSWYVSDQATKYTSETKILIAQQEATLISIAEVIDRDGADSVVSDLVNDCVPANRERFDSLLGTLSKLSYKELIEVDQLFDACGDFYSVRKAVMVARFSREYEVYADYVRLLSITDSRSGIATYPVESWKNLVELEKTRSSLVDKMVSIQADIITALLDSVSVTSPEMLEKIAVAQEVKDTLSYTGVRIDTLRADIIDL